MHDTRNIYFRLKLTKQGIIYILEIDIPLPLPLAIKEETEILLHILHWINVVMLEVCWHSLEDIPLCADAFISIPKRALLACT